MCGLCGVFQGSEHWTDASAGPEALRRTRRQARLHRVAATNRVLGYFRLKLSDWRGCAYVLSGPTGQSQVIDNVAAVWPAAARMQRRAVDPLDDELIAALERAARK